MYGTDDMEILGAVSMRNCDIIIERNMKHTKILEVLCHEVVHALTHGTSLEMTETQVQVVANSLYQLGVGHYLWEKAGGNMIPNYDAIVKKAKSLCDNKNIDYAQQQEPFSNFQMVEALKICETSTGILVRISDKIAKLLIY